MIDYYQIYRTFIGIARDTVGSELSTSGSYPSVIRSRQTGAKTKPGPKPDFPYVTVDILTTGRPGGYLIEQSMPDDNTIRYENVKEILINYTVFGGNSKAIAEDLEFFFSTDVILERVRSETSGQVRVTDDIIEIPQLLSTSYSESSSFNLTFAITDVKDITSTDIKGVEYTGDVFRSDEDTNPLPMSGTIN